MRLMSSFRHNVANLTNFSGRETRAQFWPYVGAVFLLFLVLGMGLFASMLAQSFGRFEHFAEQHPDSVSVRTGPGRRTISVEGNHPELMPEMGPVMIAMPVVCIVVVALLAAAITRRLHDRGKPGLWGALPLPFLIIGIIMMPSTLDGSWPGPDKTLPMFLNNMLYLAAVARLIVWLAGVGDVGENRYGPQPVG